MKRLKLAILDLYDNTPNQGMRCIKEIVETFEADYDWNVFDVRGKAEVPDLNHDIFISSGGPGNPLDGDGNWDKLYFDWLDALWKWNAENAQNKKHAIFICHSFQMACNHFKLGKVIKRNKKSFGTFPVHMTDKGIDEPIFNGLSNPFYVADFRDYQVVQPDLDRFEEMGATILALEKIRPHVPLDRALMGIRFSDEMIGLQFHPEADPEGMLEHFNNAEERAQVIDLFGEGKLLEMIDHLNDEDKIKRTHNVVLPSFLKNTLEALKGEVVLSDG